MLEIVDYMDVNNECQHFDDACQVRLPYCKDIMAAEVAQVARPICIALAGQLGQPGQP